MEVPSPGRGSGEEREVPESYTVQEVEGTVEEVARSLGYSGRDIEVTAAEYRLNVELQTLQSSFEVVYDKQDGVLGTESTSNAAASFVNRVVADLND